MNQKESPRTLDEIIGNVSNGNLVDKKISIYSIRAMTFLRYVQLLNPEITRSEAAKQKLYQIIPEYHQEEWDIILQGIPIIKNTNEKWIGERTWLKKPIKPIVRQAFNEIRTTQDKIIMVYSPQIATLFKYLKTTTVRFNKSTHGAEMLENILERQYPRVWNVIDEMVVKSESKGL